MKPIEVGCKAIIIGGKDDSLLGKTVVVGKFVGTQFLHTSEG